MLIAAERREAQVADLGGTKEILKFELKHATDTQAAYYVVRPGVSMHRISSISGEVRAVVGGRVGGKQHFAVCSFKKSAV